VKHLREIPNPGVAGSNPAVGTTNKKGPERAFFIGVLGLEFWVLCKPENRGMRTFGRRPVVSLSRGNEGNPAVGTIRRAKGFPVFYWEAFYLLMAGHKILIIGWRDDMSASKALSLSKGSQKSPERGFFHWSSTFQVPSRTPMQDENLWPKASGACHAIAHPHPQSGSSRGAAVEACPEFLHWWNEGNPARKKGPRGSFLLGFRACPESRPWRDRRVQSSGFQD
jgi:hypothetical protein